MRLIPMLLASLASAGVAAQDLDVLRRQVWATECEFAASMARRDLEGFDRLLAEHTLFFAAGPQPLQGRAAVRQGWARFYEGAEAPFSWEPDQVVVLGDGSMAYSSGPVRNAKGELLSRFYSVWRQEAPGRWRIVMDRGGPLSEAEKARIPAAGQACK